MFFFDQGQSQAVIPNSNHYFTPFYYSSFSMGLIFKPIPFVVNLLTYINSKTVFFIFLEISLVGDSIRLTIQPVAVHAPVAPSAFVSPSISPFIHPFSVKLIIYPLSFVLLPIRPNNFAFSMFFAILKCTFVPLFVLPIFNSFAVLQVIPHHSIVISSINKLNNPFSVCSIFKK